MNARTIALALGTAVTTFLLAGAESIELAPAAWGDSPWVGIVAVFVGLVVGALAGGLVASRAGRLLVARPNSWTVQTAIGAYATFGAALLAIAAVSYVDVLGVEQPVVPPSVVTPRRRTSVRRSVLPEFGPVTVNR